MDQLCQELMDQLVVLQKMLMVRSSVMTDVHLQLRTRSVIDDRQMPILDLSGLVGGQTVRSHFVDQKRVLLLRVIFDQKSGRDLMDPMTDKYL